MRASSARGGFDSLAANAPTSALNAAHVSKEDGFEMKLSRCGPEFRGDRHKTGNLPPRFSRERSHLLVRMPPRPETCGRLVSSHRRFIIPRRLRRCSERAAPRREAPLLGTGARLSDHTHALAVRPLGSERRCRAPSTSRPLFAPPAHRLLAHSARLLCAGRRWRPEAWVSAGSHPAAWVPPAAQWTNAASSSSSSAS